MTLRPFFSYFGGKWKLAPKYPAPEHDVVIEPFAGSAGYATRFPDREVILVERSAEIAAMWTWLTKVSVDEVMSIPLSPTNLDGLSEGARALVGFWCARGRTRPATTTNSRWMTSGRWSSSFWGEYIRARIATQVPRIRHWKVIEGDYTAAPDIEATWFVDPPYEGSRHYTARVGSYVDLAGWCRSRQGLVIACEQGGADWLPFTPIHQAKSMSRDAYSEVAWVSRAPAATRRVAK